VLNALGLAHVQGKSFAEQTLDEFATPVVGYTRAHFIIAKAASRFMIRQGGGVILALSTPGSVLPGPGFMGYGVACAALEAMTRHLAGELGAHGVRAVCLRADAIPEALARSHSRAVFAEVAARHGLTPEAMLAAHAERERPRTPRHRRCAQHQRRRREDGAAPRPQQAGRAGSRRRARPGAGSARRFLSGFRRRRFAGAVARRRYGRNAGLRCRS
jgi:NAD(P)-dependent dehydrogenase (short-subunit alcohol dehydrogenase family)